VALEAYHRYIAHRASELASGAILDFGCGHGNVVGLLRSWGCDAYGVDVFWGGMDWSEGPERQFLDEGIIREIKNGCIPFEDDTFDLIVSAQVLEHVDNLAQAIGEMARVLKPEGVMYHEYPTRDIWLEPHSRVPFSHRIPLKYRTTYLETWRRLGVGRHPLHIEDPHEWAAWGAEWMERYCSYRSRETIETVMADYGFVITHDEVSNCLYRTSSRAVLRGVIAALPKLASASYQRLGSDCVIATRGARPLLGKEATLIA